MDSNIHDSIIRELECINGKCIVGDPTVIVFDILKNTTDLDGLCQALGIQVKKKEKKHPAKSNLSMFDQLLANGIKLE